MSELTFGTSRVNQRS